jgi:hypothetical protein
LRRPTMMLLGLVCLLPVLLAGALPPVRSTAQTTNRIYLPLVAHVMTTPFGAEIEPAAILNPTISGHARQLGLKWIRLNYSIRWRAVQPTRGAAYDTTSLAVFERDLQAARALGLTPIVTTNDSPAWATINRPFPTSCGAIRADRLADFAAFMGWLAARYRDSVSYWEIGNEPDIDPALVRPNDVFGCWGDKSDPYYGGGRYGNMLKVVTPAIKRANPSAQVVIGGLAMLTPSTTMAGSGKPENFFEGILRSGAAKSFDVIAYHSYPPYTNQPLAYDYDLDPDGVWADYGGATVGKAKFLRGVMAKYGVDKPLFLNETGLTCPQPPIGICAGVGPTFLQAQSDYLVRMMTRLLSMRVQEITWFTLQGPGWYDSGLLDGQQQPRRVYYAYQQFIARTSSSGPPVAIHDYDRSDVYIEAYRFRKGATLIDVVWARDLGTYYLRLPPRFTKAYSQYGAALTPIGPYLAVSFSPVYIEHTR